MPIKERDSFFNVRVTTADGKATDYLYKSQQEALRLEQIALKEKWQFDVLRGQAFVVTTAESLADISNVIVEPEAALAIFNYGAKLFQQNLRARHMKNPDWQGAEGDCELIQELQEIKATRRSHVRTKTDELAGQRREFKKLFAKRHPDAEMPSDEQINKLLNEIFEKQVPQAMVQ